MEIGSDEFRTGEGKKGKKGEGDKEGRGGRSKKMKGGLMTLQDSSGERWGLWDVRGKMKSLFRHF